MVNTIQKFVSRLDVASGSGLSKVFVLIALGACLTLLHRGRAEAVLPLMLVVMMNPRHWARFLNEILTRFPILWFAGPLLVIPARVVMTDPMPPDDLLRYVAQSAWPGGYRDMYFEASLPSFEQYPAFDGLMDLLAPVLGLTGTVRLVIAMAWVSFTVMFSWACWRRLEGVSQRPFWMALALLLAIAVMGFRLTLGRPEIFLSIWALASLVVTSLRGALLWSLCGVVLGLCYWLSPIYFVFVILLPISWRNRGLLFAVMLVTWSASWVALTGDVWFDAAKWMFKALASRHPELSIGENQSIFAALSSPIFLILVYLIIRLRKAPGGDWRLLALAAFLALSNQIRYFPLALCLLILYAVRPTAWAVSNVLREYSFIWIALLFAAAPVSEGLPSQRHLPRFALPEGARVFTLFGEATYGTLFFNAGKVRVTPAFELGSASPIVQSMNARLSNEGQLQCEDLQRIEATHVVEATLNGAPPQCLRLEAVQGHWRLWRVATEP